jgi:uncharacterized protein YjbI with pentapeptide repeats
MSNRKSSHFFIWVRENFALFLVAFWLDTRIKSIPVEKDLKSIPLSKRETTISLWRASAGTLVVLGSIISLELYLSQPDVKSEAQQHEAITSKKGNLPESTQLEKSTTVLPVDSSKKDKELSVSEKSVQACPKSVSLRTVYCLLTESKLLPLFETFAIAIALILYLSSQEDRREQSIREDWALIDGARGSETSGARLHAIERLYAEKVSLRGLDVPCGDLSGIKLDAANLTKSNFVGADVQSGSFIGANLEDSNLTNSNFNSSNLSNAILRYSSLKNAKFENAILLDALLGGTEMHRASFRKANLAGADLRGARLQETVLRGADLRGCKLMRTKFYRINFQDVILDGSDISRAEFRECQNLTFDMIEKTVNWQDACFENTLHDFNLKRIAKIDFVKLDESDNLDRKILRLNEATSRIRDLVERIKHRPLWIASSPEELRIEVEKEGFMLPELMELSVLLKYLESQDELYADEILRLVDSVREDINENQK